MALAESNFNGCLAPALVFIRHRMAENNQHHLSHGFKNIVFMDYRHIYIYRAIIISVFGKSGTTIYLLTTVGSACVACSYA